MATITVTELEELTNRLKEGYKERFHVEHLNIVLNYISELAKTNPTEYSFKVVCVFHTLTKNVTIQRKNRKN